MFLEVMLIEQSRRKRRKMLGHFRSKPGKKATCVRKNSSSRRFCTDLGANRFLDRHSMVRTGNRSGRDRVITSGRDAARERPKEMLGTRTSGPGNFPSQDN